MWSYIHIYDGEMKSTTTFNLLSSSLETWSFLSSFKEVPQEYNNTS